MSEEEDQQQQQQQQPQVATDNSPDESQCHGDKTTTGTRKRTRATADQLSVLEDTFSINVSPNSKLRKQLAERLKMSDRSIQIWFQNRRAKMRQIAKRTRMQMHQATIRQQLYQYQHQQQQPALMPYYPQRMAVPPRAVSVDALSAVPPPLPFYASPSVAPPSLHHHPSSSPAAWSRQSMPPTVNHLMNFPDFFHGQISPSPSPHADLLQPVSSFPSHLVTLSEAGPHTILSNQPHTPASTPPCGFPKQASEITTIDPSIIQQPSLSGEENDLYLSATTLTIGSWHRMKLHPTDLVCVYRPQSHVFAWHIADNECHFKMEVSVDAVSSIEYVTNDVMADLHFDISEPPRFYMNPGEEDEPDWIQCSDFTEGKQASRFFRQTLQGVAHHLKQELLTMIEHHEETRRLVHFTESPAPLGTLYLDPNTLWNNNPLAHSNPDAFFY
ncbi:hypothetical protein DFQ28_006272 [Apophysomyces sp. BC1034]|nr:hypothetical protein DFQ30_001340 [Apophysomyces sp. BC1015]KAG0177235.1 hypothetical protein DFQ29_005077 [Apophysomyces sp. BC1021]KAG0187494.1 hypothetical protein DFQ28_006272 [Apophysomyces sp. BC1034]